MEDIMMKQLTKQFAKQFTKILTIALFGISISFSVKSYASEKVYSISDVSIKQNTFGSKRIGYIKVNENKILAKVNGRLIYKSFHDGEKGVDLTSMLTSGERIYFFSGGITFNPQESQAWVNESDSGYIRCIDLKENPKACSSQDYKGFIADTEKKFNVNEEEFGTWDIGSIGDFEVTANNTLMIKRFKVPNMIFSDQYSKGIQVATNDDIGSQSWGFALTEKFAITLNSGYKIVVFDIKTKKLKIYDFLVDGKDILLSIAANDEYLFLGTKEGLYTVDMSYFED